MCRRASSAGWRYSEAILSVRVASWALPGGRSGVGKVLRWVYRSLKEVDELAVYTLAIALDQFFGAGVYSLL